MNKVNRIFISLSVVLISFFFIDEGKTMLLIVSNIQIHLVHNHTNELEIPHQHNLNKSDDDEKLMNSNSFELSGTSEKLLLFPYYLNKRTEDFSGTVWQPPKST